MTAGWKHRSFRLKLGTGVLRIFGAHFDFASFTGYPIYFKRFTRI